MADSSTRSTAASAPQAAHRRPQQTIGIIMNGVSGPHGLPPAPRALDPRDPRAGRRAARRRRDPGAGRADPRRPQRGQARRARRQARHRALHDRPRRGPRRRRAGRSTPTSSSRRRAPRRSARRSRPARPSTPRSPPPSRFEEALELARLADEAGIKNGVVHDKLYLPGLQKLKRLIDSGLLRPHPERARRVRLLGLRGRLAARPAAELELPRRGRRRHHRRHVPALELRAREPLRPRRVGVRAGRHRRSPSASTRRASPTPATADDAAYAIFELEGGVIAQLNSSWTMRVNRDELVEFQVDGTHGSRRRRPVRLQDPAAQRHPEAGVEPRPRRRARLRRRLDRGAGQRRVRERLQDPVGGVHPPRRRGRPERVRLPRRRPRRAARRGRACARAARAAASTCRSSRSTRAAAAASAADAATPASEAVARAHRGR